MTPVFRTLEFRNVNLARGHRSKLPSRRIYVYMLSVAYAFSIWLAYIYYLNPTWGYYGFTYRPTTPIDIGFALIILAFVTPFIPLQLHRPSASIQLVLFTVLFIPTLVITLCVDTGDLESYWTILLALSIGFAISSKITQRPTKIQPNTQGLPGNNFVYTFLLLWIVIASGNVFLRHSIMSFAGTDDIYEQREIGASRDIFSAYSQTIFSTVINPTLLALGLLLKRRTIIFFGVTGSILMYAISAQRAILILPIAIYGLYSLQKSRVYSEHPIPFTLAILSILNVVSCFADGSSPISDTTASIFTFRAIGLPGLAYSQYYDLFTELGYTWWSHVKLIDIFIPPPSSLANNPLWPGLGYIVGEFVYGKPNLNANASLFSGDGVAAGGAFGVLVISFVYGYWMRILDSTAAKWDKNFSTLAIIPFAVTLTNGHFFTALLSFGGLAWLAIFIYFKPKKYKAA